MSIPGFDPENAQNFEEIEMQFAVKTVEHLEVRHRVASGNVRLRLTMDRLTGLREADHFCPAIKAKTDTVSLSRQVLCLLS